VPDADLPKPELLPCGYLVGDINSISLELKGIRACVGLLLYTCITDECILTRVLIIRLVIGPIHDFDWTAVIVIEMRERVDRSL